MDAADEDSAHDVGGNIIPMLVASGEAEVYDFSTNRVPATPTATAATGATSGRLDAYYDAHMDLLPADPVFNLYNLEWPILTWSEPLPPAKLLGSREGADSVVDSLLCAGVRVEGGTVRGSVLSPGVTIAPGAVVEGAVLLDGVEVGRGAVVRRAILDKNVRVPEGAEIGVHADVDRERFKVSDGGVVVIGKGQKVE